MSVCTLTEKARRSGYAVPTGEDVTTTRRGRRLAELARLAAPLLACGGFSLPTAPARRAVSAPGTQADRGIGLILDPEFAALLSLVSESHSLRAPPQ